MSISSFFLPAHSEFGCHITPELCIRIEDLRRSVHIAQHTKNEFMNGFLSRTRAEINTNLLFILLSTWSMLIYQQS